MVLDMPELSVSLIWLLGFWAPYFSAPSRQCMALSVPAGKTCKSGQQGPQLLSRLLHLLFLRRNSSAHEDGSLGELVSGLLRVERASQDSRAWQVTEANFSFRDEEEEAQLSQVSDQLVRTGRLLDTWPCDVHTALCMMRFPGRPHRVLPTPWLAALHILRRLLAPDFLRHTWLPHQSPVSRDPSALRLGEILSPGGIWQCERYS